MQGVRVVAVKGNARSGKTVGFENHALKRWAHGPWGDVFWYMQSDDAIEEYMEERGEWMLQNHEQIAEKIDDAYRRNARDRKRIGESLALWMAASPKTLRGKGAAFIVADEIDSYSKRVLPGLLTLLKNRQREFGTAALLAVASHPDAGPNYGVESIIAQGLRHLWWHRCGKCGKNVSPCPEADVRLNWNVAKLLKKCEGVERTDILDIVQAETRLICPHCGFAHDNDKRIQMTNETGAWVQPGQSLGKNRKVIGKHVVNEIMGFSIQAFMTPFITIGGVAREWVSGKFLHDDTGDDSTLRYVTVHSLGEVYEGAKEDEKTEDWKVVKNRMQSCYPYLMRTVPPGCHFLTAFVDIQGDRFEVRVVGWSQGRESWLIDAFAVKQIERDGVQMINVDPFNKLKDWAVLEDAVLKQSYPLSDNPTMHLPISRVAVDLGGGGNKELNTSATINARLWASGLISRKVAPIQEFRIMLVRGSAHKSGELYGKPKQVTHDDRGIALPTPVWERTANVHEIKRIIAKRMKITTPGPGKMNAPTDLSDRFFREIVSERLIGGEWVPSGRNETWDGWVACETARATLQPEREGLDFDKKPPYWARPFAFGVERGIEASVRSKASPYSRMLRYNRGLEGGGT